MIPDLLCCISMAALVSLEFQSYLPEDRFSMSNFQPVEREGAGD